MPHDDDVGGELLDEEEIPENAIRCGPIFHVTEPWSLFAGGQVPIGFTCPGEDCAICKTPTGSAIGTVVAVDRDIGTFTVRK